MHTAPAPKAGTGRDTFYLEGSSEIPNTVPAKFVVSALVAAAALSGCATQDDLDSLRQEVQQVAAQAAGAQQTVQQALEAARAAQETANAADQRATAAAADARQTAQDAVRAREEARAASEKADRIFQESLRKM